MGFGFYLYGIFPVPGPRSLSLKGLDQQPVHTYLIDGFAILYSVAQQERYLASRRNLLGHAKVLEEAMQEGYRTVLPLQFGMTVANWEAVTETLTDPYGESLRSLLQKLDGRREVSVKIFWDNNAELQALMADDPDLRQQRDQMEGRQLNMEEVIDIGQAIEQGIEDRKQAIEATLRTTLNPLAAEVVENDLLTDAMIYNAAYLINWDEEAAFAAKVEALDEEFEDRLRIRYNNFTAPFNFAQLTPMALEVAQ